MTNKEKIVRYDRNEMVPERTGVAILLVALSIAAVISIFVPISVAGPENLTALTISADTSTVYVGVQKNVKFSVSDENSTPIKDAKVQLTGAASESGTTDNSGNVVIHVNATNTGDITAIANKTGFIDGSTTITAIEPKHLTISADTSTVYVGVQKDVKFSVSDENSAPIKDAKVQLTGAAGGSKATDTNGIAIITINATNTGDITATASKSGYNDGSTTIDAVPPPTPQLNLTSNVQLVYIGKQTNVTFTVNRKCGTVSGDQCTGDNTTFPVKDVDINLDGAATGSGTTNLQGQVVIAINATSPGTITATANKTGFIDGKTTITADYQPIVSLMVERGTYYYGEGVNFVLKNDGPVAINPNSWAIKDNAGKIVRLPQNIGIDTLNPGESVNLSWDQKDYNNSQVVSGTYKAVAKYSYHSVNYNTLDAKFNISNCVIENVPTKNLTWYAGDPIKFGINLTSTNRTWDFKWYINGTEVFNQSNVYISTYINNTPSVGVWNVSAVAKSDCNQITWTWIWTVVPKPSQPSNSNSPSSGGSNSPSGGGSSGGGGGVVSGESFNNIIKFERQDADLFSNKPVTYSFKDSNFSIYQVVVTGTVNEGDVGMRIEHLRNASALVNRIAPGNVYVNENVWLGSKRISSVLLRFRVSNSWIANNNIDKGTIQLLRFNNEWTKLNTKVTGNDDNYTYFEARTSGLSSFAVSALSEKQEVQSAQMQLPEETTANVSPEESNQPTETPTENTPGFEIPVVLGAISAIYLIIRKNKK